MHRTLKWLVSGLAVVVLAILGFPRHEIILTVSNKFSDNVPFFKKVITPGHSDLSHIADDSHNYYIKNGILYFHDAIDEVAMANADLKTFKELKDEFGRNYIPWAVDEKSVFFGPNVISGADPKSFNKKSNSLYDNDASNYFFEQMGYEESMVDGIDYESFRALNGKDATESIYAKDINAIYCSGSRMPNADPTTFIVDVSGLSSHDARHVYDGCSIYDPKNP